MHKRKHLTNCIFISLFFMHSICHSTTIQKEHAWLGNQIHDDRIFQQIITIINISLFIGALIGCGWQRFTHRYYILNSERMLSWCDHNLILTKQVLNSRKSLLILYKWFVVYFYLRICPLDLMFNFYTVYNLQLYYQFLGILLNYSMFVALIAVYKATAVTLANIYVCVR